MSAPSHPSKPRGRAMLRCECMTRETSAEAFALLSSFLGSDPHYAASSAAYGALDEGALERALELFLEHPDVGCVWLAFDDERAIGACVVCYAISTSRGGFVAKLDDVTVTHDAQGRGVGTAMLSALARWLSARGVTRIDTSCHRDNRDAWSFYAKLGFRPLDEERVALLLEEASAPMPTMGEL